MKTAICSRCNKNIAVIFITKLEGGAPKNEGICLRCAKELNIQPVNELIQKLGLSDDELDDLSAEMLTAMNSFDGMSKFGEPGIGDDDLDDDGKTATFPLMNRIFNNMSEEGGKELSAEVPSVSEDEKTGDAKPKQNKRRFLDSYCIDLTERARDGKLDALIGRHEELERVIQILNRRQKNNPCLIGEPGVGKTAIAEGLASSIASGNVPYKLRSKEVHLLDLTSLVAGTQFRGQFESRMKGLIDEIRKAGNIILVIDEVHNIVGADRKSVV